MLVAIACGAMATPAPQPAAATSSNAAQGSREAQARARLAAVRARIAKIAAAQHATAATRDAINARLTVQARKLDQAARALRETDAAIAASNDRLDDLQRQIDELKKPLAAQRAALAELLRAVYTLDRGSDLALLLGDEDIARISRALAYSRYFQRNRTRHIATLLDRLSRLSALQASQQSTRAKLQHQRDLEATQKDALAAERDAQRKLLARADAQLARQKDKLASLQRDAEALNALLKRLHDVFSDIPAQVGKTTPFGKLRGKLPWPVAGKAHAGTGALVHGLVIAARPGAEVRAVAYGRIAWADFMRGYGMLVIIDHGNGWMSLYGGNEAALVEAGDWVQPGQPVATVGADPEQGGAWFGLRHDGKPVDPAGWFAARR